MGPLSDHLAPSGQSQVYIHTSKTKQTQRVVLIYLYIYMHIYKCSNSIKKEIMNLEGVWLMGGVGWRENHVTTIYTYENFKKCQTQCFEKEMVGTFPPNVHHRH